MVAGVLKFLLEKKLLVKKAGQLDFGKNVVHVPHDSPFVMKHHSNWRMKALQSMDMKRSSDLHYTAPVSLSADLVPQIREELIGLIQKYTKQIADSPSESLMCLNIDWFEY
ncbi:hypothetical protein K2X30_01510 [bacterium]|nr:hypothetical protein [bacterium]